MSLTNKTIGGFIWMFSERFGSQVLQIIIFVVLARILAPEAFGLIGMLAVFITLSQSLTDSGFGQALIQKKDADELDYSSVFYINIVFSIAIYLLLFLAAPQIANFFNEPILIDLVRILGLRFVFAAFSMVQITKLVKELRFKELLIARLPSTILGGVAGISAAYMGLGVWSLIIQQLTNEFAYSLQIWIQSKWIPSWSFNFRRVKSLFSFGSKLMLEGVINSVYKNFYEIMIGRNFAASEVGFYTQANKLKQLPVSNISNALSKVTFPILSGIQHDDERLKGAYKKIIRQIFLIIAPLMAGGIVLAEPAFRVVLTDTWLPAVPYFQWLCISGLFYPANAYNINILKVKGRSDLVLYLGLVKKGVAVVGILILVQYSVLALVIFKAFHSLFAYILNSYVSGRFINYGILEQIKDIWKIILAALTSSLTTYWLLNYLEIGDLWVILFGILFGLFIYGVVIYKIEHSILVYSRKTLLYFKK